MPWTIKDVDKHKKGLTPASKKKWISIANSVRKKCLEDGDSEDVCDAKAIRVANSKVQNNTSSTVLRTISTNVETQPKYKVKQVTEGEDEYLIVPVVMMVEGVHNGNRGPIYHKAETLAKYAEHFNDIPVTISHPINEQGLYVSVNTPGIMDSWGVGKVRNSRFEDGKLKADAWLDVMLLASISPEALQCIQESEEMEVSIGTFSDEEVVEGVWNNEKYKSIALNYSPDHLALLPGEIGACSIKDGCGLRVNKQKGGKDVSELSSKVKELLKEGYSVLQFNMNVDGFQEIIEKAWNLLSSMETETKSFYLIDVYDNHVIYRMRNRLDDSVVMLRQSYTINEDGSLALSGEPQKVRRDVNYVEVNKENVKPKNKEVKIMCEKCPEKVDELIANSATNFTKDDREWLDTLTEDKLDKLIPKRVRSVNTPEITVDKAWEVINTNSKGVDDYLKNLPADVKVQVEKGLETYKEEHKKVVKFILDNTAKEIWEEEELNNMSMEVLKKIQKTIESVDEEELADYSAQSAGGNGQQPKKVKIAPLAPIGVTFKE
jgi:arsenate reductase-like glutaredoxin family protein